MSSGAGLVLAEERREEEGEGSDRTRSPGGGDGERVRTVSSDSQSEGGSVSGELGPPVKTKDAIVKGRRVVCVCGRRAGGGRVRERRSGAVLQREPRRTTSAPQLRDTAANVADRDTTHEDSSSDRVAYITTTNLQQFGRQQRSWCCGRM